MRRRTWRRGRRRAHRAVPSGHRRDVTTTRTRPDPPPPGRSLIAADLPLDHPSGTGSGWKSKERITRRSCVTVAKRGELTQLGISPTRCFGHDRRDLIQRQHHRRRTPRSSPAITPPACHRHQLTGMRWSTARLSTTTNAPARRSPSSATHPCPTLRRPDPPVGRRARCGDRTRSARRSSRSSTRRSSKW